MAYTTIDDPAQYFNTVLYTGTGSSNAITGVGFQPDWVWIKSRSLSQDHKLHDSVRGTNGGYYESLRANSAAASDVVADGAADNTGMSAIGSDGFTVGSQAIVNGSGNNIVGWNWKGGSSVSNTNGSITSTVRANAAAGFSIVTWTGTGTNSTVGHGLSAAPDCIWIKNRTDDTSSDGDASGRNWVIFNSALGSSDILSLNQTNNKDTGTGYLNGTDPTSTVFSVGESVDTNESSHAMIAYCWHNIVGYQKFGTYTGNGNADGPYVNLGFRPRLVITKMTNGSYSEHWNMWDSVDDTKGILCR